MPYHPPVKQSVTLAGHQTSVSLEPLYWELLRTAAQEEGKSLNALVAAIDAERLRVARPPGLAGAIRVWLTMRLIGMAGDGAALRPSPPE